MFLAITAARVQELHTAVKNGCTQDLISLVKLENTEETSI